MQEVLVSKPMAGYPKASHGFTRFVQVNTADNTSILNMNLLETSTGNLYINILYV